jgi:hypothetical protein
MSDYLYLDNKQRQINQAPSGMNYVNVPKLRGDFCYARATSSRVTFDEAIYGEIEGLNLKLQGLSPMNYFSSDNGAPVITFLNKKTDTLFIQPDKAPPIDLLIRDTDLNNIKLIATAQDGYVPKLDKEFDTIVIRRPTGITGELGSGFTNEFAINLREVQLWVNGSNILFPNSGILRTYFANFADNDTDIGFFETSLEDRSAPVVHNNIFEFGTAQVGAFSPTDSTADIALIIKNIPRRYINDIQSLVVYNRIDPSTGAIDVAGNRTIGLAIELYNETNDPGLTKILATTQVITTNVERYRYDFPSFDTYTLGTFSGDSTTQITSDAQIEIVETVETRLTFNTVVIRRDNPDNTTTMRVNELQIFVNNANIMFPNASNIDGYWANWNTRNTPINFTGNNGVPRLYNNAIQFTQESISPTNANAAIMKNIPLTAINDIHAVVMYYQGSAGQPTLSPGLVIELYNTINDPDLLRPLAYTNPITNGVYLHRYNFPAINSYTNGFFTELYASVTQIPGVTKTGVSTEEGNFTDGTASASVVFELDYIDQTKATQKYLMERPLYLNNSTF